jgi:ribonucleoside-diphosphate reductase alpha chain
VLEIPEDDRVEARNGVQNRALHGRRCKECGNTAVIHKDGCEFCTACGAIGACG